MSVRGEFWFKILACFVMILNVSCRGQQPIDRSSLADIDSNDVIIKVKANPCYGTCKAYELIVTKQGKSYLEAKENFVKQGIYLHDMNDTDVREMTTKFESAGFFKKSNKNNSLMSDGRSYLVYAKFNDMERTMNYRSSSDSELDELVAWVNRFVDNTEWVDIEPR